MIKIKNPHSREKKYESNGKSKTFDKTESYYINYKHI